MKHLMLMATMVLALTSCDTIEVEREIGYKGVARINPWLAAERMIERMDHHVRSVSSWTDPRAADAVWMVPASVLNNTSFTGRMETWVRRGGHLILLVEYADQESNDWAEDRPLPVLEPACLAMLERAGFAYAPPARAAASHSAESIEFSGRSFKVDASSHASVAVGGGAPGVFASLENGRGRITVLTDARLFRNRWIDGHEHAALLAALIKVRKHQGTVGIMRGSGLSFWSLLCEELGPVLFALCLWLVFWLWKNLLRFGPLEAAAGPPLMRAYEHHLDALGHFQWRLDRCAALLTPLRQQVIELGHRACARVGCRDEGFHQFLAERAGLPPEHVSRVLADGVPNDPAALTRTTADLQQLVKALHNPSKP